MKFYTSAIFTLALLISIPASAINWENYKKSACIAFIALTGYDFFTKEKLTVDEMETKRAIAEEESVVTMSQRLFSEVWVGQAKEVWVGQAKDERDEEKPATGIVGNCYQITKDHIIPITSVIVLVNKTSKKIADGLRTLGLDFIADRIPSAPSYALAKSE